MIATITTIGELAAYIAASSEIPAALKPFLLRVQVAIRALVERIVLVPEEDAEGGLRVALQGDLAAILALGDGGTDSSGPRPSGRGRDAFLEQIKLVAGARCHLYRTRMSRRISRREGCLDNLRYSARRTRPTT